jgi:hypothetical protein
MKRARLLRVALGLALLPVAVQAQIGGTLANWRPYDQRGLNVFEPAKDDTEVTTASTGRIRLGVGFTQQYQALDHRNTAAEVKNAAGVNTNQLMEIGTGFNLATANLYLDAQLADGIRVNLTSYLSSRHHSETWVKGGYVQVDRVPFFDSPALDRVFDHTTLRIGHYEVNYGDAHFRRSDNGNAMYNPFVGNLIMDAFTTEIGAEAQVNYGPFFAIGGLTGGEIQGGVTNPQLRSWAKLAKVGFDEQLTPQVRARLTGSLYTTGSAVRNTLYGGDRAGSRFYMVMENSLATLAGQAWSGLINPNLTREITALQLNPFVKVGGLELFGVIERATGHTANEEITRTWNQYAVDAVFRFLPREQAYVGVRYNQASGPLTGPAVQGKITTAGADVSMDRVEITGGWFATRNILTKLGYVQTNYRDFPASDIRNGGKFNGFMVEGVITF